MGGWGRGGGGWGRGGGVCKQWLTIGLGPAVGREWKLPNSVLHLGLLQSLLCLPHPAHFLHSTHTSSWRNSTKYNTHTVSWYSTMWGWRGVACRTHHTHHGGVWFAGLTTPTMDGCGMQDSPHPPWRGVACRTHHTQHGGVWHAGLTTPTMEGCDMQDSLDGCI